MYSMETFADNRARVAAFVTLLIVVALPLQALDALSLEQRVARLTSAGPPEFWKQQMLLTYMPEPGRPVRYVGARFEHENWGRLHVFSRKPSFDQTIIYDDETGRPSPEMIRRPERDVFYLVYDNVPPGKTLRYRIVVDGLWMSDPSSTMIERDVATGLTVSVVVAPMTAARPLANPTVGENGHVRLVRVRSGDS